MKTFSNKKLDLIFDPESKHYKKRLRKSSDALLQALRASELYPDTHSIREGIMLGYAPEHVTSFMTSPALMCAQLGEPELSTIAHLEYGKRTRMKNCEPQEERNRILNKWWVK